MKIPHYSLSILLVAAFSCGEGLPSDDEVDPRRGGPGKADGVGSCVGVCGGQASGGCWCDDKCIAFADCCDDKEQQCGVYEPAPPPSPCTYPTGPYGYLEGDVLEDFSVIGYADPAFICADASAMTMDLSQTRTISMRDYHCNTDCPIKPRRFLWLVVNSYFSGVGLYSETIIQEQALAGAIPPELHVLLVMTEVDTSGTPPTVDTLKTSAETFELHLPIGLDLSGTARDIVMASKDFQATPTNLLIDLSTMTIVHRVIGGGWGSLEQILLRVSELS